MSLDAYPIRVPTQLLW